MKNSHGPIGETGVWHERTNHVTDISLLSALMNLFSVEKASVYDLGCGAGGYSKGFKAAGVDVECYDGSPLVGRMTDNLCDILDLAYPVPDSFKAKNWVLSLEVGEHIPKEYEQQYIDNVTKLAEDGVVISWAIPGQRGYGHVNCQTNDYVIAEFEKRNFSQDVDLQKKLRDQATFDYFTRTVMAFRKTDV